MTNETPGTMVSFDWELEAPHTLAQANSIASDIRSAGGQAKVLENTDKGILPAIPFIAAVGVSSPRSVRYPGR